MCVSFMQLGCGRCLQLDGAQIEDELIDAKSLYIRCKQTAEQETPREISEVKYQGVHIVGGKLGGERSLRATRVGIRAEDE